MPRRVRRIAIDEDNPDGGWDFDGKEYDVFVENKAFDRFFYELDIGTPLLPDSPETAFVTVWATGVLSLGRATDAQIDFMANVIQSGFFVSTDDLNRFFPGEFVAFAWDGGRLHDQFSYGIDRSETEFGPPGVFAEIDYYQVNIDASGFYVQTSEYFADWDPDPKFYDQDLRLGVLEFSDLVGSGGFFDVSIELTNFYFFNGTDDPEVLRGTMFADTISGFRGDDLIFANGGDDVVESGGGLDEVHGGEGNDLLIDENGGDLLLGGKGADTYQVIGDYTTIVEESDEGHDTVYSSLSITLSNNVEDLFLTGAFDIDGLGNDERNKMIGNDANNRLAGRGGNDLIRGKLGDDHLEGDLGNDRLEGGVGDDKLFGEDGDDELMAGPGADLVNGGDGDDVLNGGAGADRMFAGTGFDRVAGGSGADLFIFNSAAELSDNAGTADVITDFEASDTIRLRNIDANTTLDGDQNFRFIGTNAFSGTAGELRYYQGSSRTVIEMDTDGDGQGDLYLRLNGQVELSASDFIL